MQTERHVRLFRNGRNQVLRIPREFELDAEEAIIRKDGNRLIVVPVSKRSLLDVLATLKTLDGVFPDADENLASLDDTRI